MTANSSEPRHLTRYSVKKVSTVCCDSNETLPGTVDCLIDIAGDNIKVYRDEVQKYSGECQLFNIPFGVK